MAKCIHPTKSGVLPILSISVKHNWLTFRKMGENFFIEKGFQNGRKLLRSSQLMKAVISHGSQGEMDGQRKAYNLKSVMFTNVANSKARRAGFLCQLREVQYLARPGIAFQGHTELDGNWEGGRGTIPETSEI